MSSGEDTVVRLKVGDPTSCVALLVHWTIAGVYYFAWHNLIYVGGRGYRYVFLILLLGIVGGFGIAIACYSGERRRLRIAAFGDTAQAAATAGTSAAQDAGPAPVRKRKPLVCAPAEVGPPVASASAPAAPAEPAAPAPTAAAVASGELFSM